MKSPGTVSPKLSRSITHTLQAITLQLRRVLQTDLHVTVVVFPSPDADVYTNQNTFLRKIHTRFLKFVQPIESLLMDELVAGGIMSSDDEKEVSAKETRRDRARHLWKILHRVPPALLENKCLPAMKKHYPHVLERATFRWDGKEDPTDRCLRHAIMKRMRLRRFADIFPPANACTQVEYRFDMNWILTKF